MQMKQQINHSSFYDDCQYSVAQVFLDKRLFLWCQNSNANTAKNAMCMLLVKIQDLETKYYNYAVPIISHISQMIKSTLKGITWQRVCDLLCRNIFLTLQAGLSFHLTIWKWILPLSGLLPYPHLSASLSELLNLFSAADSFVGTMEAPSNFSSKYFLQFHDYLIKLMNKCSLTCN